MDEKKIIVKASQDSDLDDVLQVESFAFGNDKEADVVRNLLKDDTASPCISLLAFDDDKAVGHILMTTARLDDADMPVSVMLLGPLAVIPEAQNQGVGIALSNAALDEAKSQDVDLVFVLGHPDYYPRFGFVPAGQYGFDAPYPIPPQNAPAWMIKELREGLIGKVRGTVKCAKSFDSPEFWRE